MKRPRAAHQRRNRGLRSLVRRDPMKHPILRLAAATLAAATVLLLAGPATARQPRPVELRITTTGTATAVLTVDGYPLDISAVVNSLHPAGWTGEGNLVVQAVGDDASCRIVVNGAAVAEQTGGP